MTRPTKRLKTKQYSERTHEGAAAPRLSDADRLRRSVMSCMLFEKTFYEEGEDIATRISELAAKVDPGNVLAMALVARTKMKLRHAPMLLCKALLERGAVEHAEKALVETLRRADEPAEFLALWWEDGKRPIPHAMRRGIAAALRGFNEYQLAKYNRKGTVTLKDVLRLCHPVPETPEQSDMWHRLLHDELTIPDTWEVALSSGEDKKEAWTRLLSENKLGALALLRNLRNMREANVDKSLVRQAMGQANFSMVLPFRFIAAAKMVPEWEDMIDEIMQAKMVVDVILPGKTWLLVDNSGSMYFDQFGAKLSAKSILYRGDAAAGLAMIAREMFEDIEIFSFSNDIAKVPPRRGMALRDAIKSSQKVGGTWLGRSLEEAKALKGSGEVERLIVITDEQTHDEPAFFGRRRYLINVGPYESGIGYGQGLIHIDGFSERTLEFVAELEQSRLG